MNCSELRDHYELYAIGVAEEPERSEIRAHLNRQCEVCMQAMKQAREVAALLGTTAPPAAPSPGLRRRILASVGAEERRFGWAPWLAAALALSLFAVVYFVGRGNDMANELARARDLMRRQDIDLTRLNEAFAIINGSDTTVTSFGEGQKQPPKGKVFVSPSHGMLLFANNLPPAPAGKRYEMWLIPKGQKPKPAGMFQSSSDGTAMHMHHGMEMPAEGLVAVTLEDERGADQPTTNPLFAAPIHSLLQ